MDVLIVEDDPIIGKSIRQGLEEAGHRCTLVRGGNRGLEEGRSQHHDVILLDVMLPERSGMQVLQELRGEGIQTPAILVTALGSVEERVAGLSAGADDYMVKPFAIAELMARIDAVCRRVTQRNSPHLRVGELSLDLSVRRASRGSMEIDLTPTEFSLLEFLMRHAGNVVTRRMLCEHLWESDWEGATNVIEVHINRLRGKLDKGLEKSLIQTVRGKGYALRVN